MDILFTQNRKMYGVITHWCLFVLLFFMQNLHAQSQQWSWFYRKQFESLVKADQQLHFLHSKVPDFNQLLFSWNALRPHAGYFSFHIKVHKKATGTWSPWLKMIEWGAGVQRSFHTKSPDGIEYVHVRLETENVGLSDGFCIQVQAHEGAQLSQVRSLAVNVCNKQLFVAEDSNVYRGIPAVYLSGIPCISQFQIADENNGLCSPTSCTMLVRTLTKQHIDPLEFAQRSFDHGLLAHGSWPFNMAHAYECSNERIFFANVRLNSFNNICQILQKGIPVVVSVRGEIPGAPRVYNNGHLLLIAGVDPAHGQVICHDPAAQCHERVVKRYNIHHFLAAWERSHRLAYIAEPIAITMKAK